jgi:hypothetical protein
MSERIDRLAGFRASGQLRARRVGLRLGKANALGRGFAFELRFRISARLDRLAGLRAPGQLRARRAGVQAKAWVCRLPEKPIADLPSYRAAPASSRRTLPRAPRLDSRCLDSPRLSSRRSRPDWIDASSTRLDSTRAPGLDSDSSLPRGLSAPRPASTGLSRLHLTRLGDV